jgi:hypothetical protein
MPDLECIIDELPYAGVIHKMGDKFFASDEDARLLKGFGKARDAAEPAKPSSGRGRYRRADMRAEG